MVKKPRSEQVIFFRSQVVQYAFGMVSWQNWPLKFKRTSPRRQWPRRWFLWAVCRTISSALSWIPSLMIFEIRFLFVVCLCAVVWLCILRLLVAVGFNGHWWCSYATSDQCNWYDLASVVSPTKRCTVFIHTCSMVLFPHGVLLAGQSY